MKTTGKESVEEHEDELVIDTSKLSSGEEAAMRIAEASREKEWSARSFCSGLFMGNMDFGLIAPFPKQTVE